MGEAFTAADISVVYALQFAQRTVDYAFAPAELAYIARCTARELPARHGGVPGHAGMGGIRGGAAGGRGHGFCVTCGSTDRGVAHCSLLKVDHPPRRMA